MTGPDDPPVMLRYFHRTSAHAAIAADGFRDATDRYMADREFSGVWLSDTPLDRNEGAHGDALLAVDLPAAVAATLDVYEWVEDGKPYREWLVPAALLNDHAQVELLDGG